MEGCTGRGRAVKQTPSIPGPAKHGPFALAYLELVLICDSLIACGDLGLSVLRSRAHQESAVNAVSLRSPTGEGRHQHPYVGGGTAEGSEVCRREGGLASGGWQGTALPKFPVTARLAAVWVGRVLAHVSRLL